MPRVSTAASPGCPPLRVLTGDELGLIKVVEVQTNGSSLQQSAKWGEPERRRSIQSMSISDGASPILAAARRDGTVDLLDPSTGEALLHFNAHEGTAAAKGSSAAIAARQEGATVCGLQTFQASESRLSLVTCTEAGAICVRHVDSNATQLASDGSQSSVGQTPPIVAEWGVLKSTNSIVTCMQMDGLQKALAVGGKGAELSTWDLETKTQQWAAKAPKPDNLGLLPPPWVTAVTFMSRQDSRRVAIGTGRHSIRLYDVAAQRRPVMMINFGESPIKSIAAGEDENLIYVGNGVGELAEFDFRIGKLVGAFKGAQAGSVRSMAKHPSQPLLASCGLDRFLRIHNTSTRTLLGKVFLKQPLMAVLFNDSAADKQTSATDKPEGMEEEQLALEAENERGNGGEVGGEVGVDREAEEKRVGDRKRKKRKGKKDALLNGDVEIHVKSHVTADEEGQSEPDVVKKKKKRKKKKEDGRSLNSETSK